ncbi:penicillin-binding protein 2 [Salinibacterium sp. dk2585]|uniref:peptidoglycan D,D-transpeptidase FtsI family protein n=1 Tax=unclassified Salinibacterium TaxID=2632331 RepID=UPI0011C247E8|nr:MULTISPECIES: penicillin-binding transpeptidase domain-containing protein [unclassified Salinibacterium]QEE62458.1 penicillin-binding protein 2 [Salinibacterium sp. dk2585]TXK55173.1 penicillin-binding protein 2 [Salinibacterium sp. dk5596]
MNRELKRVSAAVLLMFVALFASGTIITVFQEENLRADPRNVRTLYASFSAERGPILVDGAPVAESIPVDTDFKFQRVYTQPLLYSHVTGYYTLNQGTAGIEGALNDYLTGTANDQFFDQLSSIFTGASPKGAAVELTIDPVVQQAAWDALGDYRGAVVAIDPATGAILAMVSKPSFDPNLLASHDTSAVISAYEQLSADPTKPLDNRAIGGDLYHPGSVFKVLTTAAALDSGAYEPDTAIPNPPTLKLPQSNSIISNAEGGTCGGGETVSLRDALRLSCNIPFAQIGASLGENVLDEYADAFGFGDRIRVPMPATPSIFPDDMDEPQLMLSSFGQASVRTTPLQIAMVTAAVANGGTLMQPTLVERILAPDLTELVAFEPSVYSEPISAETAETMVPMMVANVANGAASNARMNGVDVGGKTGTAQNSEGSPNTLWFTGFAPASDPQIAIAVVVENGSGFGNQVAAPIAKKVFEAVLSK